MKTIILNFSGRENGNCKSIANFIKEYKNDAKIIDIAKVCKKPCGTCNYECFDLKDCGNTINELYMELIKADLIYFIIPSYCGLTSSLFNIFYEKENAFFHKYEQYSDKYLEIKKKFIFVANYNFEYFYNIASMLNCKDKNNVLFLSSSRYNLKSVNGDLLRSDAVKHTLKNFIFDKISYEKSAMAVVISKNKILCTKEEVFTKEILSLPKGHIENDESIIEAAIRECYEEANVKIQKDDYVTTLTPFTINFINEKDEPTCKTIIPVLFLNNNVKINNIKEERIKEIELIDIKEFITKCSYSSVKDVINEAILTLLIK